MNYLIYTDWNHIVLLHKKNGQHDRSISPEGKNCLQVLEE